MIPIALATEDRLSEAVGLRLLREASQRFVADPLLRKGGAGYLKSKMNNWQEIAVRRPVLLLTDLDRTSCAPALVANWCGATKLPKNLLLRVAVREVESWILADHEGFAAWSGVKKRIVGNPDELPDPKRALLELARHARREIREDLVPAKAAIASQGLGYNAQLCAFVEAGWNPARASKRSPSLSRARVRLAELAGRIGG